MSEVERSLGADCLLGTECIVFTHAGKTLESTGMHSQVGKSHAEARRTSDPLHRVPR